MQLTYAFVGLVSLAWTAAHPGHDHDVPGYAAEVYDSPPGLAAAAEFKETENSAITGRVIAAADPIGSGTVYHFTLFGLPMGKGPFGVSGSLTIHPESLDTDKIHIRFPCT